MMSLAGSCLERLYVHAWLCCLLSWITMTNETMKRITDCLPIYSEDLAGDFLRAHSLWRLSDNRESIVEQYEIIDAD